MIYLNYKLLLALLMAILIILLLIKLPEYSFMKSNIKADYQPLINNEVNIMENKDINNFNNTEINYNEQSESHHTNGMISNTDNSDETLSLPGALMDNDIEKYASF